MSGQEGSATPGRGRLTAWRWGTPFIALLVGGLFVTSAVNSDGIDLRPQRYGDLAGLAEAERADYEKLEARLNALDAQVDELASQVDDGRVSRLQEEAEELRDPAGLTPREGPGITVELADAPEDYFEEVSDTPVEERPNALRNLNNLIVHQQDIQAVVNSMWRAGATAVTIQGQRVVSTTGIKCEGSVVQLQGLPYGQPYVISAVGDPDALRAAVESDERMQNYRQPVYQMGWSLEQEEQLEAPPFTGLINHQYAEPLA